jgi:bacterioferritin-associated ferredoxin
MSRLGDEMKIRAFVAIALQCGVCIASESAPAPALGNSLRARLSDEAIRQAVRETLAETKENPRRHEADVLSADQYQRFSNEFHEAKVPYCMHPDGLKRQPTNIGPINFVGLYAVPFVFLAKMRGKCL